MREGAEEKAFALFRKRIVLKCLFFVCASLCCYEFIVSSAKIKREIFGDDMHLKFMT